MLGPRSASQRKIWVWAAESMKQLTGQGSDRGRRLAKRGMSSVAFL